MERQFLNSKSLAGWLLCLPALGLFLVFFLGPACIGFVTSLYTWDGISDTARFVGLKNYLDLFMPDRFWQAMRINLIVYDPVQIAWLGRTDTALSGVLIATTWYYFGLTMLLFLAGLAAIPEEYIEAARMETNRRLHILRYVILPMLREVFLIVGTMTFAGSFGHIIGLFFLITGGGPPGRTEVVGLYMYNSAFRAFEYGYASAISVVMIGIVLAVVAWPVRGDRGCHTEFSQLLERIFPGCRLAAQQGFVYPTGQLGCRIYGSILSKLARPGYRYLYFGPPIACNLRHRSGKNHRRPDSSVEIHGALVKWCVGELKIFNNHFTNSPIKRSFHVPFR